MIFVGLIAWGWQESRLLRRYAMSKRRFVTLRLIALCVMSLLVFAAAVAIGVAAYDWLVI